MKLSDYDYDLPRDLIAQYPVPERDRSRLMVLHRTEGRIEHRLFRDLVEHLDEGDCLVFNETKVIPARLVGEKATGGKVEVFLTRQRDEGTWEALVRPGKRVPTGTRVIFNGGELSCEVIGRTGLGGRIVRFEEQDRFEETLERIGRTPLPPYIRRDEIPEDRERYQTVYAKTPGAVAAPTAGLHFTEGLLESLKTKGVRIVPILLHVGVGTFRPVTSDDPESHRMHPEYYEITHGTAEAINRARAEGRKVVAVGTTTVRTLESSISDGLVKPGNGWTRKFIYPPYEFRAIDALITNFHLPRSTLLMLVAAFAGREFMMRAYKEAIRKRYRFLSYGDAMLIL
ncbi:MAG TPA: tRNA preQ1(34) S-adenosylmethionine ribosyltransferase-isomerase QueA [Candidatus Latescibacteria bacterium]|nr:tRNA preQ1(34) S-adenosylmethionine ribosyltransferase-isomerase QueA [Candidatus Latescibacterota bacterium]